MKRIIFGVIIFSIVGLLTRASTYDSYTRTEEENKKILLEKIDSLKFELSKSMSRLEPDEWNIYMSIYDAIQNKCNLIVESLKLKNDSLQAFKLQLDTCRYSERSNLKYEINRLKNEIRLLERNRKVVDENFYKLLQQFKRLYKLQQNLDYEIEKYEYKYGTLSEQSEKVKASNIGQSSSLTEDYNKAVARLDSVKAACRGSIDSIEVLSKTIGRFVEGFVNLPKDDYYFKEAVLPAFKYVNLSDAVKAKYEATYKKDIPAFELLSSVNYVNQLLNFAPQRPKNVDKIKIAQIKSRSDSLAILNNDLLDYYKKNLSAVIAYLIDRSIFINKYDPAFFKNIVVPSFDLISKRYQDQILDFYSLAKTYPQDCAAIGKYVRDKFINNKEWKECSYSKGSAKSDAYNSAIKDLESQDFYKRYKSLGEDMQYTILGRYLQRLVGALQASANSDSRFDAKTYSDEIYNLYLGSLSPDERARLEEKRQAKKEEAKQKRAGTPKPGSLQKETGKSSTTAPSPKQSSGPGGSSGKVIDSNGEVIRGPVPASSTVTPSSKQSSGTGSKNKDKVKDKNGDVKSGSKVPAPRKNK